MGTAVRTQHDDFDDVEGRGAIPILHDQDIYVTETRLSLDVGLTKRFAASVMLPVRVVDTNIRYLDGAGTRVDLVSMSPHHRNETLGGIADPMVLGAIHLSPFIVRVGASLPVGRTEEDPFVMPETPHQHIQMGTGTVNPVVAVEAAHAWDLWRVSGFLFTQQVVYENAKGYHAGDRYAAGVAIRRTFDKVGVRVGFELQAETYERWGGIRYLEEGNQGRVDGMFAVGANIPVTSAFSIDIGIKAPFVTHVKGGQLDMPALLDIGASYVFGSTAKPDDKDDEHEHGDHDHAHGDEHDHDEHGHEDEHGDDHGDDHGDEHVDAAGADVADLGANGSAVTLTPVPGKITIFDFWAEWCVPCKKLEPVLVEIAKQNPRGVALRRIDAVDWESPVVAQHLTPKGFDLPHVKIYSATGELLYEESSAPGKLEQMIQSIRALAGASPQITVTEHGFEPANITVPRGVPVTLRFHRQVEKTCATEVLMTVDGKPLRVDLPLGKEVDVRVTFPTAGTIDYGCAMDQMVKGTITVR